MMKLISDMKMRIIDCNFMDRIIKYLCLFILLYFIKLSLFIKFKFIYEKDRNVCKKCKKKISV
jgi:hypothetical protein